MRSGNLVKHKVERTADGKQFSNTPRGFCRNTIIKHTPGREWTFSTIHCVLGYFCFAEITRITHLSTIMWKRLWIKCYYLKNKTDYPHLYKNWDKTLPLCGQSFVPIPDLLSLVYKRLTVCTFLYGWVSLVCAYLDYVQCTVILILRVMGAVLDGTLNAFVLAIDLHGKTSFKKLFDYLLIICRKSKKIPLDLYGGIVYAAICHVFISRRQNIFEKS